MNTVMASMDESAEVAKEELKEIPKEHAIAIATWWRKNYMKAGHKRLAKILLSCE